MTTPFSPSSRQAILYPLHLLHTPLVKLAVGVNADQLVATNVKTRLHLSLPALQCIRESRPRCSRFNSQMQAGGHPYLQRHRHHTVCSRTRCICVSCSCEDCSQQQKQAHPLAHCNNFGTLPTTLLRRKKDSSFNPTGSGPSGGCPDMTLESNLKSTSVARWLKISLWLLSPFGVRPFRVLSLRVWAPRASPARACPWLGVWRQLQPAGHNICMGGLAKCLRRGALDRSCPCMSPGEGG